MTLRPVPIRRFPARRLLLAAILLLVTAPLGGAQPSTNWTETDIGGFVILTASEADARLLPQLTQMLRQARRELEGRAGLDLPETVTVVIHPDLHSYREATGLPWFMAARADRASARLDSQRLRVLQERSGMESTLRHELFHLAQPQEWPRWRAEGSAMLFAGEVAWAPPLQGVSEAELDRLLANPPDRYTLGRAAATALQWSRSLPPSSR